MTSRRHAVILVEGDCGQRARYLEAINATGRYVCLAAHISLTSAENDLRNNRPRIVVFDPGALEKAELQGLARLRRQLRLTDFLAHSLRFEGETVLSVLKAGVTGYICKEHGAGHLAAALDELLAGRSPLHPAVGRVALEGLNGTRSGNDRASAALPASLTRRENEILAEVVKGSMLKEITSTLDISQGTVNTHLRNLYRKLNVNSRHEIMIRYFTGGEVAPPSR